MITNIRYGFATNSSSSHSIVILRDNLSDKYDAYFGWNHFIAKSYKAKLLYFVISLKTCLPYEMEDKLSLILETFPEFEEMLEEYEADGYVDHQSLICCPKYLDGTLATQFYRWLVMPTVKNKVLAVVGGNDNELEQPYYGEEVNLPILKHLRDNRYWKIRDENFGWILFNVKSGTKLRIEDV